MKRGYKQMLSDRMSFVLNAALQMCKAKTRWIDHVYYNFVNIYTDRKEKSSTVKCIMGLNKRYKNFDFHKTINWDDLNDQLYTFWQNVEGWYTWLSKTNLAIYEVYNNLSREGTDENEIISILAKRYKVNEKRIKILIKLYKKYY